MTDHLPPDGSNPNCQVGDHDLTDGSCAHCDFIMESLPPEVVEKLAEWFVDQAIADPGDESLDIYTAEVAEVIRSALLAHAGPDATHIDLSTWQGARVVAAGGAFGCVTHDWGLGVDGYDCDRKYDRTPCAFVDLYRIDPTEDQP